MQGEGSHSGDCLRGPSGSALPPPPRGAGSAPGPPLAPSQACPGTSHCPHAQMPVEKPCRVPCMPQDRLATLPDMVSLSRQPCLLSPVRNRHQPSRRATAATLGRRGKQACCAPCLRRVPPQCTEYLPSGPVPRPSDTVEAPTSPPHSQTCVKAGNHQMQNCLCPCVFVLY